MKVIDLLNKIANGEEVKYALKGRSAIDDNMSLTDALIDWLSINYEETEDDTNWLNDEVEIIEDKEYEDIEELNKDKFYDYRFPDDWEEEIIHKIDTLVRNQKKIIEKLKGDEK